MVTSSSLLPTGADASVPKNWDVRCSHANAVADTFRRRGWAAYPTADSPPTGVRVEAIPEVKLVSNLRGFSGSTYREAS